MAKKVKKIKLKTTARGEALQADEERQVHARNAFSQHILTSKTRKRKRGLKGTTTVSKADTPKIARCCRISDSEMSDFGVQISDSERQSER